MAEQIGLYSTDGSDDNSFAQAIALQAEAEKAEAAKVAAEQAEKAEAAKIAAEQAERAEAARIAAEQAERAEAARIAAEQAEKAEAAKIAAEQAAKLAAEEAARLAIEAETIRRIAEEDAEALRKAEEAKAEAERQARAREEAKKQAIEAEKQAKMAEQVAEEYRRKAREARSKAAFTEYSSEASADAQSSADTQRPSGTQSSGDAQHSSDARSADGAQHSSDARSSGDVQRSSDAQSSGSAPSTDAQIEEAEYATATGGGGSGTGSRLNAAGRRSGAKWKNSLEVGFVLALCAITLSIQAITGVGLFKKDRGDQVRSVPEQTVIQIEDTYEEVILPNSPESSVEEIAVVSPSDHVESVIVRQETPFGLTIEVEADFAAFDPDQTYKGFPVIPVKPITWTDGDYEVTLTGITGSTLEPFLLYDIRINDPVVAEKVTSVEPRIHALGIQEYQNELAHYTDEIDSVCMKDPDVPGLYHVVANTSYFTSMGDDFVHQVTGLQLHMGDIAPIESVNMRSVLHIDRSLFSEGIQLYSDLNAEQKLRYGDLYWFSCYLDVYTYETSCSIRFNAVPGSDQRLNRAIWTEFVGKLKLVVNGTSYDTLPYSAGYIGVHDDGDQYGYTSFPVVNIHKGDEVYLEVDGERMEFSTGWLSR